MIRLLKFKVKIFLLNLFHKLNLRSVFKYIVQIKTKISFRKKMFNDKNTNNNKKICIISQKMRFCFYVHKESNPHIRTEFKYKSTNFSLKRYLLHWIENFFNGH